VAERLEQPETTSRRGALAALIAFFRWPFQGGVVPLKVAAITATVATTAAVAVTPLVGDDAPSPARTPIQVERQVVVPRADVGAADKPKPVMHERTAPTKASVDNVPTSGPAAAAPPTTASAGSAAATPPPAPPPLPDRGSVPNLALPDVTVPTVEVPSVTIPPLTTPAGTVTLPEISLPPVDVPDVELPPLPPLPSLP
jgi:hypothetical protein